MPRTLPWLVDEAVKKEPAKRKKVASSSPTPRQSRKRSSSPTDLVTSDLDAIPGTESPKAKIKKEKKWGDRSPSAPPAPAAPQVEYMNDGFSADDIYMMVEDEFDSTARLFTQHIHHAEYQRLRRLHKSRGAETLRNLGRGTDGKTEQSRALRLKLEARELAKKRGEEPEDESEEDDEYKLDPQLAGLMTGSQKVKPKQDVNGLAKVKSNTRAAAGYARSPHKGNKWKDVPDSPAARMRRMPPIIEDESIEDESTDEDDLDAIPRDAKPPAKIVAQVQSSSSPGFDKSSAGSDTKSKSTGFFKAFAGRTDNKKADDQPEKPSRKRSLSPPRKSISSRDTSAAPKSNGTDRQLSKPDPDSKTFDRSARVAELLARRRQTASQQPDGSQVKIKKEVEIKKEPESQSYDTFKSRKQEKASSRETEFSARRQKHEAEEKEQANDKEKERKKKRDTQVDDIPTFLF